MRLLVIIPAYNEEENIARVVNDLRENYPQYDYVVINDGSRDHTLQVIKNHQFNYVDQPINLGLSATFQTGLQYALNHGYDAVLQFDGDGQHQPQYIRSMMDKMEEGYDVVVGSRFVDKPKPHSLRMFGSNLIGMMTKICTGQTIKDPTSGMRMLSKRIVELLAKDINLGPEPDTIVYLIRCGAKLTEVPVEVKERIAGESYLNITRSIQYMLNVCLNIMLIGWFREKVDLEK
ncbi:MAG: glycosyltransferase family 2 protein [Solobacterium sp.]|nr:glycosyltransferase family 2 protein [Solobacterium sp.]